MSPRRLLPAALALGLLVSLPARARGQDAARPAGAGGAAVADTGRGAAGGTILPGDRVLLRVWREPSMSDTLWVDERGDVVLPRFGRWSVANRTIAEVQDSLRERFSAFLRNPSIQVAVLRRIGVFGEVNEPGIYYLDVTMTLREVIAQAGGITESGNANRIRIVRHSGEERAAQWRFDDAVSASLRSGDQVVVPRRSWLAMNALAVATTVAVTASVVLSALRR